MTITEALKDENIYGIRVVYGDKQLVCSEYVWKVYQHAYGARKVKTLYDGDSEDDAVEALLNG